MPQFGVLYSNDNVLEEGNKLTSISIGTGNKARRRINERRTDSVNISPSGTERAAFTFILTLAGMLPATVVYCEQTAGPRSANFRSRMHVDKVSSPANFHQNPRRP